MFATSVPISLAGWGMRELSAVVGLGAIGVPAHAALTAAVTIGIGSLLVVGVLAAISVPQTSVRKQPRAVQPVEPVDYYRVLTWILPLSAAILVLFQVYIPVQSGLINANLADPFAILGGVLFLLTTISLRRTPQWRVPHINLAVTAATFALTISLFVGAYRFGRTTWAVVNRFFGWFVLLAYGATGGLIVNSVQKIGFRTILLTFAGAAVAIAGLEIGLARLKSLGFQVPIDPVAAQSFALNRNLFAFQLVMAMSVILTFAHGAVLRIAGLAAIMAHFFCRITLRVDCRYFRAPGRLLSASDQRTENTLVDRLCRHSLCCANSGWIRSSSSGRFADGVIDTRTPGQHHRRIELVLGSSRFWRRPRRIPQYTRWATARYSFDRCLASG